MQGQADYFSTLNLPGWLVQWVSAHLRHPAALCHACAAYTRRLDDTVVDYTQPTTDAIDAAGPPWQHGGGAVRHGLLRLRL